jgi:hypothetical protein
MSDFSGSTARLLLKAMTIPWQTLLNTMQPQRSLILFSSQPSACARYICLVARKITRLDCKAIVYQPFAAIAPGIKTALQQNGIDYYEVDASPT